MAVAFSDLLPSCLFASITFLPRFHLRRRNGGGQEESSTMSQIQRYATEGQAEDQEDLPQYVEFSIPSIGGSCEAETLEVVYIHAGC